MSCCGNGKLVTFELANKRLITLDLDCDEDWGDINIDIDANGESFISIGNDVNGYVTAIRFFEEIERPTDEIEDDEDIGKYIERKWQTFSEVDKTDVIEWVLVRMLCFCDGYTMEDLERDLKAYGIDINKINVPEEWKR